MGMGLAGLSLGLVACGAAGSTRRDGERDRRRHRRSGAAPPTASTEIPEETAGPFPGDGSNGPDVLTESGVVRKDIRRASARARPSRPASR